jgi:hypothetical protein
MPDRLLMKGSSDRTWANVNEAWELKYWAIELDVSEDQLRAAIKAVGTRIKDIRKELGKNPAS